MSNASIEASLGMQSTEKSHRLAAVAEVLRANNMPQETINMILAARCGLPMEKVDPRSLYFNWVDESKAVEPVTETVPEKRSPYMAALDIVNALGTMELGEGLGVLAMAASIFAGPRGYSARVVINENVEVAGGGNG